MNTKANPFTEIFGICPECGQLSDRHGEPVDRVPDDSPGILRDWPCRECRNLPKDAPIRELDGALIAAITTALVLPHLGLLMLINL